MFADDTNLRLLREPLPFFKMDNIAIERKNVTKFLRVFINENLSWKHYIKVVSATVPKSIGILYKSFLV